MEKEETKIEETKEEELEKEETKKPETEKERSERAWRNQHNWDQGKKIKKPPASKKK
ncbi:unnamed protein product [marine sediment metagenome]|uniref:Uncharacterized protein n=1 Tax=marine sediment metagenome TaxID=412755 RepID=X1IK45_9ZZZZ